jgi:enhancing lycopene biosynthesis protein 2
MPSFSEIALVVSGLLGAIGWLFAWRARGEVTDVRKELEVARAATQAAKDVSFTAGSRAVVAETQLADERRHSAALTLQLATERQHVQTLVDALAKAGAPVGGLLVGSALDGLYEDGGGQGTDPGTGRGPALVPDAPAGVTGPTGPARRS